jgi:ABC-type sugar transport system ATPase subunit
MKPSAISPVRRVRPFLVRKAVQGGTSVIVVASDFEELAHVVDRVIVIAQGRIVAELTPPLLEASRLSEFVSTETEPLEVD